MFVSKTAFTSDRPIPLAISFDIRLSPPHDFSRNRTPGDSENPVSDAGVSGENLPPLAERPPPGRRRISCCRRPRPGSVRQGGRRSFSRRYRLMITLPGQRSRPRRAGEIPNQNRAVNLSAPPLDSTMVSPPQFDHEKLDVYQLELKFLTWVTQFLANLSGPSLAQAQERIRPSCAIRDEDE